MVTAAVNNTASGRRPEVCFAAAGGGSVSFVSKHGGWSGGDFHVVVFVLGPRRHGGASSGVVARMWSLYRSLLPAVMSLMRLCPCSLMGAVDERRRRGWDPGVLRRPLVWCPGFSGRPWWRGDECLRHRALLRRASSSSGRPWWRGVEVRSRRVFGGDSGKLVSCSVQGSLEEGWLRRGGAMAVRVHRASVPSLAADGFCGLLHVWGASFSGDGGGLVLSSPAVFWRWSLALGVVVVQRAAFQKMVKEDGEDSPEFADAEEEKLYELLNIQLESGLNLQRMRHYEVVYLIHEDRVEEVDDVISKVQDFLRERKGRIWRVNNWGLRRLAYKIKKATHANYVLMNFEIQAKSINDFKTLLDKDERIIRHLVMKRDEAITEDCPPPPEFHAMRSQQLDDEYIDEEYVKADDGNDEGEDDNVDDDVEAGDEPEIILVDEVYDDSAEDLRRKNRKVKLEKYTAEKVLR